MNSSIAESVAAAVATGIILAVSYAAIAAGGVVVLGRGAVRAAVAPVRSVRARS